MHKLLKTAAISAFAVLGIAAIPATAGAEGIYFGFNSDGARFGVYDADSGYRHRDRWERRHDFRRDDRRRNEWRRDDRRGRDRGCSPGRALNKAERLGLNRVRLRDVDRGTIRVSGRRHGDRITVTFARAPGCPVIGF